MAQQHRRKQLGCKQWLGGGGVRGGARVALCAAVAVAFVFASGVAFMQRGSFVVSRGEGVVGSGLVETQLEPEDDGFEQFQQSSSNPQVPSSGEVETPQVDIVVVDVDGAVITPGVYQLEGEGVRVNDAVIAAGGLAEDADTSLVNLARPLEDGAKVYIPYRGDPASAALVGSAGAVGGDSGDASQGVSSEASGGLININTASNEELQTLPGIGEATATAIISDREENGPFSGIEDIMRVSGIGERKFEKLRELICV